MNDKFQILKNMAREYNPEDKSLTKKAIELANDYSKVCKSNFKLQQENQQLKEENEKLKLQNFNLREDIMIQKKSFPNKEIKDKTFFDLYDMPTYEQLKYRIDKALFELRKYKLVRNNDDLVSLSAMYEFIIDNSIEILKGDNND